MNQTVSNGQWDMFFHYYFGKAWKQPETNKQLTSCVTAFYCTYRERRTA